MKNGNHDNLLVFEVSSPEELKINLKAFSEKRERAKGRPVALALRGPKVLVCPFQLKDVALKDVGMHLLAEALEVMSLTSEEIELDYQVLRADADGVRGVYLAMPKAVLEDYLRVLDEYGLSPARMTAHFLACVDAFCQQGKMGKGRVCFLDFSADKTVSLFIANNHQCELLRKIPYEDLDEAKAEIVQSLRSASAQSWRKEYDQIYYFTGPVQLNGTIRELQVTFDVQAEMLEQVSYNSALSEDKTRFTVNLFKSRVLAPGQRRAAHIVLNGILIACLALFAAQSQRIWKMREDIRQMKRSYQASDYQYAVDLKEKTK